MPKISNGVKKLLILATAAVFLAAGCNSQPATQSTTGQNAPNTASAKVDAAVKALNSDIDAESSLEMQSDDDILTSDTTIINSYNGVSNANSY